MSARKEYPLRSKVAKPQPVEDLAELITDQDSDFSDDDEGSTDSENDHILGVDDDEEMDTTSQSVFRLAPANGLDEEEDSDTSIPDCDLNIPVFRRRRQVQRRDSSDIESDDDEPDLAPADIKIPWKSPDNYAPVLHPFQGNPGPLIDDTGFGPYEYFRIFLTDAILAMIVTETNRYAADFLTAKAAELDPAKQLKPKSRFWKWTPTTLAEMEKFIGLLILMGIIHKPTLLSYWSKEALFNTPIFAATMPRDRFLLILHFLHFCDNSNAPTAEEAPNRRLWKIQSLLDAFVANFQAAHSLEQNLAIDESLVLFKGRLLFKQYNPQKRQRFGFKLFLLCESPSGYVYRIVVYTGGIKKVAQFSASESIVLELLGNLLNKGHRLFVDNWYTSVPLFRHLHEQKTNACGTIRKNRKGFAEELKNAKLARFASTSLESGNLLGIKFMDKKEVYFLTSMHDEHCNQVERRVDRQVVLINKPNAICQYNKFMGSVDKVDQVLAQYNICRKSMKWYKKLVLHILQIALYNGYVLRKRQHGGKMTFLSFCKEVIGSMIFDEDDDGVGEASENVARLAERHFIAKLPATEKKKAQKRCRVCWARGNRRDSIYCCPDCPSRPGLCLDECFRIYHTKANLKEL